MTKCSNQNMILRTPRGNGIWVCTLGESLSDEEVNIFNRLVKDVEKSVEIAKSQKLIKLIVESEGEIEFIGIMKDEDFDDRDNIDWIMDYFAADFGFTDIYFRSMELIEYEVSKKSKNHEEESITSTYKLGRTKSL